MSNLKISLPPKKLSEEVVIGKDVIELLTGAMYINPMTLYREYIQNAADAIEEAHAQGLYDAPNVRPCVTIDLDMAERRIRIRDTGIGIAKSEFGKKLTSIGASEKRGTHLRGFRGIGRLCGLGYCQEVIFRSRSSGERLISQIIWDGRKFRDLVRDKSFTGGLAEIIYECTTVTSTNGDSYPPHFFEVELNRVARYRNDVLMNASEISDYLGQVAPVPFHPGFSFKDVIESKLNSHGLKSNLEIYLNGSTEPIARHFRDELPISEKLHDKFQGVEFFEIPSLDEGIDAVGWMLKHSCLGAIPKSGRISGLRARAGNIQIGNESLLEQFFPEQRFNSWCVGEIHVVSSKILPNARRDDFEPSAHYFNLQSQVSHFAKNFAKRCRNMSDQRNRIKFAYDTLQRTKALEEILVRENLPRAIANSALKRIRAYLDKLGKFSESELLKSSEEQSHLFAEIKIAREHFNLLEAKIEKEKNNHLAILKNHDPEQTLEEIFSAMFELSPDPRFTTKVLDLLSQKLSAR